MTMSDLNKIPGWQGFETPWRTGEPENTAPEDPEWLREYLATGLATVIVDGKTHVLDTVEKYEAFRGFAARRCTIRSVTFSGPGVSDGPPIMFGIRPSGGDFPAP
jgi:hypothetical protein